MPARLSTEQGMLLATCTQHTLALVTPQKPVRRLGDAQIWQLPHGGCSADSCASTTAATAAFFHCPHPQESVPGLGDAAAKGAISCHVAEGIEKRLPGDGVVVELQSAVVHPVAAHLVPHVTDCDSIAGAHVGIPDSATVCNHHEQTA